MQVKVFFPSQMAGHMERDVDQIRSDINQIPIRNEK